MSSIGSLKMSNPHGLFSKYAVNPLNQVINDLIYKIDKIINDEEEPIYDQPLLFAWLTPFASLLLQHLIYWVVGV